MKNTLIITLCLLYLTTHSSYCQERTGFYAKEEVKRIEELTIQSLKLRAKIKPDEESEYLNKEMEMLDASLLKEVTIFVNKYGWLSKNEIGELANMGLFLAIQHASIEEMESFKAIIEKAYAEKKIEKEQYAKFVDRLRVRKDLPQIYGTQFYYNEQSAGFRFYEVEDVENINKRRKAMKLPKIEKYAQQNNIALDGSF